MPKQQQYLLETERTWCPNIAKWKISLADGYPIGPRLKKGGTWPDFPIEVDDEQDAVYYQEKWKEWINFENRKIKRYFRKN